MGRWYEGVTGAQQACPPEFLYRMGVVPVIFLNCLVKLLRSLNPTLYATAEIVLPLLLRRSFALSILMFVTNCMGLAPAFLLNILQKWYLLLFAFFARLSSLIEADRFSSI